MNVAQFIAKWRRVASTERFARHPRPSILESCCEGTLERHTYMDDGGASTGSLVIRATFSGSPGIGDRFDDYVSDEILRVHQPALGGPTFKGFHAKSLNGKNWSRAAPAYSLLLRGYLSMVKQDGIGMACITVDSRAGFERVRTAIGDVVRRVAARCSTKAGHDDGAIAALAASAELLWWLSARGHVLGGPDDSMSVWHDRKGASEERSNEIWAVALDGQPGVLLKRDQILTRLVNALRETPEITRTLGPTVKSIRFVPAESSSAIQACDVAANFMLAYLRVLAGSPARLDRLKADEFARYARIQDDLRDRLVWNPNLGEVEARDGQVFYAVSQLGVAPDPPVI